MLYSVGKTACLLLYFIEFVFVVQSIEINDKQSISKNAKLTSTDRERRDAVDDFEDDLDKGSNELLGKGSQTADENLDNQLIAKRYLPYEELEKRLRHFIGKRTDDTIKYDKRRGRYFVGKREDDDDDEFAADKRGRTRFFLGKRDDNDETPEKRRSRFFVGKRRYFLGKRDEMENELEKRAGRYFLGKRDDTENDLDKRAGRYFLGKRRRFFLGKRSGDYLELTPEAEMYPDESQSGLRDFVQKRMRYFLGKRDGSDGGLSEMDKRYGRYFVGK